MGSNTTEYVQIKELKPGLKNINAVFIVLEVGPPNLTKEAREVRTVRVADASASVNLSLWDAAGALISPGDILRLTRGYAQLWRNVLTLYCSKSGDLQKVGEFCMLFNEQVNMSEPIPTPPAAPPGPGGERGERGERANGAHLPAPRTAPAVAPAGKRTDGPDRERERDRDRDRDRERDRDRDRFDNKHAHKTYVRGGGRGHQRNNNRR